MPPLRPLRVYFDQSIWSGLADRSLPAEFIDSIEAMVGRGRIQHVVSGWHLDETLKHREPLGQGDVSRKQATLDYFSSQPNIIALRPDDQLLEIEYLRYIAGPDQEDREIEPFVSVGECFGGFGQHPMEGGRVPATILGLWRHGREHGVTSGTRLFLAEAGSTAAQVAHWGEKYELKRRRRAKTSPTVFDRLIERRQTAPAVRQLGKFAEQLERRHYMLACTLQVAQRRGISGRELMGQLQQAWSVTLPKKGALAFFLEYAYQLRRDSTHKGSARAPDVNDEVDRKHAAAVPYVDVFVMEKYAGTLARRAAKKTGLRTAVFTSSRNARGGLLESIDFLERNSS